MLRVRCQASAKIDAKGRIALPAALRKRLSEKGHDMIVLSHYRGALWGWTVEDFEVQVERPADAVDPFSNEITDFVHAVLAPAQDVEIDKQGRIRIPKLLRELAGLEKDVVVNSVLRRLEIWDKTKWEARFEQSLHRVETTTGMPTGVQL